MFAKSIQGLFRGLRAADVARSIRSAISALILMASLAVLVLFLRDQYGADFMGRGHSVFSSSDPFPAGETNTDADGAAQAFADREERRHDLLAGFLARKYKVSQEVIVDLVRTAYVAGHQLGVDPLLIIAVMAVESRFNPIAESVAGAKGLMQVIPKYHADKLEEFGGENAVFDPRINILIGARILKEYIARTGSLGMALQMYAGALGDDEDAYSNKVMSMKMRLQRVVSPFAARNPHTRTSSVREPGSQSSPSPS